MAPVLLSFLFPFAMAVSSLQCNPHAAARAFPPGQDNDGFFSLPLCSKLARGTGFACPCLLWHNKVIVKKTLHQEADLEQNMALVVSCASPVAVQTLASLFPIVSLGRLVVHGKAGSC